MNSSDNVVGKIETPFPELSNQNSGKSDGKINPSLIDLTRQVRDNIIAAKLDFDNFKIFKNKSKNTPKLEGEKTPYNSDDDFLRDNHIDDHIDKMSDHELSDIIRNNDKLFKKDLTTSMYTQEFTDEKIKKNKEDKNNNKKSKNDKNKHKNNKKNENNLSSDEDNFSIKTFLPLHQNQFLKK